MGSRAEVLGVLNSALAASSLRHTVLANNIANVNTPGYQARRVAFEERLASALAQQERRAPLARSHPRHVAGLTPPPAWSVQPDVIREQGRAVRADGNNVDIEREMALLAANQIWYGSLTRQVQDHFQRLRVAITEGRR